MNFEVAIDTGAMDRCRVVAISLIQALSPIFRLPQSSVHFTDWTQTSEGEWYFSWKCLYDVSVSQLASLLLNISHLWLLKSMHMQCNLVKIYIPVIFIVKVLCKLFRAMPHLSFVSSNRCCNNITTFSYFNCNHCKSSCKENLQCSY